MRIKARSNVSLRAQIELAKNGDGGKGRPHGMSRKQYLAALQSELAKRERR